MFGQIGLDRLFALQIHWPTVVMGATNDLNVYYEAKIRTLREPLTLLFS